MKTCLRAAATGALSAFAALGQWSQDGAGGLGGQTAFMVCGEVSSSTSLPLGLTVSLVPNGSGMTKSVMVAGDGSFAFPSVTAGIYGLRVSGGNRVLHEETVSIWERSQQLSISLPGAGDANRSAESTVSLRQLQHQIPARARKAYEKGRNAAAKGNGREAAEHFREALTLDAGFADAYNDLGASYLSQGKLSLAAEQFQKTIDLAPEHRLALPNLSIALIRMNRYREAGEAARRALKADPGNARIHLILAASLLAQRVDTEDALFHLQRASADIPKAHLLAAEILIKASRRQEAAKHLEEYLRIAQPQDAERAKAESWLTNLQQDTAR